MDGRLDSGILLLLKGRCERGDCCRSTEQPLRVNGQAPDILLFAKAKNQNLTATACLYWSQ